MNGEWLPSAVLEGPDRLENVALIQFLHRWMAALLVFGAFLWWRAWGRHVKSARVRRWLGIAVGLLFFQFCLGVATLLKEVPLALGLLHQATALILFGAGVVALYGLRHGEIKQNTQ